MAFFLWKFKKFWKILENIQSEKLIEYLFRVIRPRRPSTILIAMNYSWKFFRNVIYYRINFFLFLFCCCFYIIFSPWFWLLFVVFWLSVFPTFCFKNLHSSLFRIAVELFSIYRVTKHILLKSDSHLPKKIVLFASLKAL